MPATRKDEVMASGFEAKMRPWIQWLFFVLTIVAIGRGCYLSITTPITRVALVGNCSAIKMKTRDGMAPLCTLRLMQPRLTSLSLQDCCIEFRSAVSGDIAIAAEVKLDPVSKWQAVRVLVGDPRSPGSSSIIRTVRPVLLQLRAAPNQEVDLRYFGSDRVEFKGVAGTLLENGELLIRPSGVVWTYTDLNGKGKTITAPFCVRSYRRPIPSTLVPSTLEIKFSGKGNTPPRIGLEWKNTGRDASSHPEVTVDAKPVERAGFHGTVVLSNRRDPHCWIAASSIQLTDLVLSSIRIRGEVRENLEKLKGGFVDVKLQGNSLQTMMESVNDHGIAVSIGGATSSLLVDEYNALDTKLQLIAAHRLDSSFIPDALLVYGWLGTIVLGIGTGLLKKLFSVG